MRDPKTKQTKNVTQETWFLNFIKTTTTTKAPPPPPPKKKDRAFKKNPSVFYSSRIYLLERGEKHVLKRLVPLRWRWSLENERSKNLSEVCPGILHVRLWCNGGVWNLPTNYLPHPPIIPFVTHQISRFFMRQIVMARNSMESAYQPHPPFHYSLRNTPK